MCALVTPRHTVLATAARPLHMCSHKASVVERGPARGLLVVNTGDAVSQLHNRMESTPQVLMRASPACMQSASLLRCSCSLDLGVDVGHSRHRRASSTMQISAEVAVLCATGMEALLATPEATGQYVASSHQGILSLRLSRTRCPGATRVGKSVEGALLEACWW